ncbi:MAG: ATP-grasp domain-containing protein [Chloroflexi bacterium]|nr:ATP-grasp domain-containing protein [Chloroflexota bacterium]
MNSKVTLIYNQPDSDKYSVAGESKAVESVMEAVVAVEASLIELGCQVEVVPLRPPMASAIGTLRTVECDVVFNLFEGFDGRAETEAEIALALSGMGIRFTGCPAEALSLALDKGRAKKMLAAARIGTPRYQLLSPQTIGEFDLSFPCIVKPLHEDASHGLSEDSLVRDMAALTRQVDKMCRIYGGNALIEEFADGREFNVTVLGDAELQVLPISEIEYSLPGSKPRILTFAAKWEPDSIYFQHTRAVCPCDVPEKLRHQIQSTAREAFRLLGCQGYARVDMRVDGLGRLMVLEVNPNPDISPGTGAARQALASGMTYTGFVEKILALALGK